MNDLTIILPTRNEREGLKQTLLDLSMLCTSENKFKTLIIDTNSTDGTLEVARDFGIQVIKEPRKGKGYAISTGLKSVKTDYAIILDADGTYPAYFIPLFYSLLKEGRDVIFGWRATRSKDAMSWYHVLGNWILSNLASILYLTRIEDVCTGMKGFSRKAIDQLDLSEHGFGIECQIFSQTIKKRLVWIEVPIRYDKRIGQAKLGTISGFLDLAWVLIKERI